MTSNSVVEENNRKLKRTKGNLWVNRAGIFAMLYLATQKLSWKGRRLGGVVCIHISAVQSIVSFVLKYASEIVYSHFQLQYFSLFVFQL